MRWRVYAVPLCFFAPKSPRKLLDYWRGVRYSYTMENEEFDIGEEVMVTKGFGRAKGRVDSIMYDTDAFGLAVTKYGVTLDVDKTFEYYPSWQLEHTFPRRAALPTLCECGSTKLGHPGHSGYCPLFRKDKNAHKH